jgi:solute carrier family 35 protein E4
MLNALTPFATVALSVLILAKSYHPYVWLSMIPMCGGILLCIKGEVNYDAIGVMASLCATLFRAIKSILSEAILHGEARPLRAITDPYLYHF